MADKSAQNLLEALERIWDDVALRKMYITGGVGPLHHGDSIRHDHVHEAFDRETGQGEAGEVHWVREHVEQVERRLVRMEALLEKRT